ncbi:unnamed protein product [Calypogeia fissa]
MVVGMIQKKGERMGEGKEVGRMAGATRLRQTIFESLGEGAVGMKKTERNQSQELSEMVLKMNRRMEGSLSADVEVEWEEGLVGPSERMRDKYKGEEMGIRYINLSNNFNSV